jgi:hypothetical protein
MSVAGGMSLLFAAAAVLLVLRLPAFLSAVLVTGFFDVVGLAVFIINVFKMNTKNLPTICHKKRP